MNVLQHTRNERNPCLKQNRPDRSYRDTLLIRRLSHCVCFKNCIFWTNQSLNKSYGEGNRMISFHSITMHKGNREGKHTSKFCPLKSHWYTLRKRRHSLGQSIWLKSSILSDDRKLQIHNCYLNVRGFQSRLEDIDTHHRLHARFMEITPILIQDFSLKWRTKHFSIDMPSGKMLLKCVYLFSF